MSLQPGGRPATLGLPPGLVAPRYGEAALADLLPSLLGALGVAGEEGPIDLPGLEVGCVLLVDGLGWDLLRAHRDEAPYLNGLADDRGDAARITAGFPTTTTTSLTSLGTGRPAGEHGMTGYQMRVPGTTRLLNALQWDVARGPHPHAWQPHPTTLQRAAAAGVDVTMVAPAKFAGSGLTEAALRGGRYVALPDDDGHARTVRQVLGTAHAPALAYVYYGAVDRTGHVHGVQSQVWRAELRRADEAARDIAAALPSGGVLVVTADHGMVDVDPAELVDVSDEPALRVGVELLAGEGRCRYVHTTHGAARDVLDIWCDELEDGFTVLSREETIDLGLLGPSVSIDAAARVGDVVVLARGAGAVFDRRVDSSLVRGLVGQHGSLTPAEVYVPLLLDRAG